MSELEPLMDALADFAAGAGHEINNPLAIISGHAQILLKSTKTPEEQRHLAAILAQVKRAYEMIADIRSFSRPPEPVLTIFNLTDFFNQIQADYQSPSVLFSAAVTIDWQKETLPPNERNLSADSQLLRSVFDALIRNATEAGEFGKTEIIISPASALHETGKRYWKIYVEDNGPGIPAEIRKQIFFPYFSGREFGRGLGFGLPRSWAIMKKMGGSLSLDPQTEKNRFLVELF